MSRLPAHLATLALLGAACSSVVLAASTASVSISDSVSTAVGSVSDSINRSSESSTRRDRVAEGDYRIVEVVVLAARPGFTRLKLQAQVPTDKPDDDAFFLTLPQTVVARHALDAGRIVAAKQRPYGVEFALGDTHEAFFLALSDDWMRELPSRAVSL